MGFLVNRKVLDWVKAKGGAVTAATCALMVGVGAGYWLSRGPGSSDGKPEQAIEWQAMAAVPTRTPDTEDNEWQGRANALDATENKAEAAPNDNELENEG